MPYRVRGETTETTLDAAELTSFCAQVGSRRRRVLTAFAGIALLHGFVALALGALVHDLERPRADGAGARCGQLEAHGGIAGREICIEPR